MPAVHAVERWAQSRSLKPAAAYTEDGRMVGLVMPFRIG